MQRKDVSTAIPNFDMSAEEVLRKLIVDHSEVSVAHRLFRSFNYRSAGFTDDG